MRGRALQMSVNSSHEPPKTLGSRYTLRRRDHFSMGRIYHVYIRDLYC